MNKYKRIFIIGHMGAGRGLLAKALSEKLGWQFIDANFSLERCIGRSLNEILGKQGEASFHECEAKILAHYITKENIVVTTNDAIVTTEENRKLLSTEFVVYLKVKTSIQLERMKDRSALLPIIDQKAFLDKMHQDLDSLFERVAKITIDSKSIDDDVKAIIQALN